LALRAAPASVLQLLKDGTFETNTVCSSNIGIDYTPAQSRRFIKVRAVTIFDGLVFTIGDGGAA